MREIEVKFKNGGKIKSLAESPDAVRGFSSGIILIGGDIPLQAVDFFAGRCTESVLDGLPDDLEHIAREAIQIVNSGFYQVKEISKIFPKRRAEYIRIHNEESRRIMKRMAKQCGLKLCHDCEMYFYDRNHSHKLCADCWSYIQNEDFK